MSQMFGGFSYLLTTAMHSFIVLAVLKDWITVLSVGARGWEEQPNIWLMVAKNAFVDWALNFRVHMLLKGAVIYF